MLVVDAYATMPEINRLRASPRAVGVTVNVGENAGGGPFRQAEVVGTASLPRRATPHGFGGRGVGKWHI